MLKSMENLDYGVMMLKRFFAVSLISLMCISAYSLELTTFKQIEQEYSQGRSVSFVIDNNEMQKCERHDTNKPHIPVAFMFLKPDSSILNNDFISFNVVKYTHKRLPGPVVDLIEYVDTVIDHDGQSLTRVSFFNADTHQKSTLYKDVTLKCKLGVNIRAYQA